MIEIRPAAPQDAPAVRALLGELGYEAAPEAIAYRLQRLNGTGSDPVFLARENSQPLALIALHHCHMLQYAKPIVRITALVVHHRARRSGIGRQLIDYTICWAKRAGCELVELDIGTRSRRGSRLLSRSGFCREFSALSEATGRLAAASRSVSQDRRSRSRRRQRRSIDRHHRSAVAQRHQRRIIE